MSTSQRSYHRQTFVLMMQNLIADTVPCLKADPFSDDSSNMVAEAIFEVHFKPCFVAMQTDKIINVRMLVSETLGMMFKRHETIGVTTPSFSSQSSDDAGGERERIEIKKKVYLKSRLCNDELIIGMVRRLSLDSNRDINTPLKHIELPQMPELSDITPITLETMRRRSPSDLQETQVTTEASHEE